MSVETPQRREFGNNLDAALTAYGGNYQFPGNRATVHKVAAVLSELFGAVTQVWIPPSAAYVAVRMTGVEHATMGAAVGYVGVYPVAVRGAEAQGVDLMARLRAALPNDLVADGDPPEGAPNGITVWHPINGQHESGTQQDEVHFDACPKCTMPMAPAASACDWCDYERS